jgi:predicted DNA-binding protein (MmcQ/YjbR family)
VKPLHDFCRSLPGVTEDIKWQHELCFCIGGKMFAIFPQIESHVLCMFKCTPETFEQLSKRDGFIPAPYLARAQWMAVTNFSVLTEKSMEEYLRVSYHLVASKLTRKIRQEIGLD